MTCQTITAGDRECQVMPRESSHGQASDEGLPPELDSRRLISGAPDRENPMPTKTMTFSHAETTCQFVPWTPSHGQVFHDVFAMDCETTLIDKDQPPQVPEFVLGAACDGSKGFFLTRDRVAAFLEIHPDVPIVFHNATFDLKVLQSLLDTQSAPFDVYARVEANQVWDTMLLHRLYCLASEGHTAGKKGESTLESCSETYLGCALPKDVTDSQGNDVRLSYGRFLNQSPSIIEPIYLEYLAKDVIATILVFDELANRLRETLDNSCQVWGYVSRDWLEEQIDKWGPQTHHIQLKGAIALDQVTANGLTVDQSYSQELDLLFGQIGQEKLADLKKAGYGPGKGSNGKLQKAIEETALRNPGLTVNLTATGKYESGEKALKTLATQEPFFQTLLDYKGIQKNQSTYLSKMNKPRLHPRFDVLKNTGRTSSFGDINAQNLPRDDRIRRCFVPSEGHVYLDADYSTIEMATLAQSLLSQFGTDSQMAKAINDGKDLHTLVASKVTGKPELQVTKDERSKAKPINFGKPGGMGTKTLQEHAAASYGITMTQDEVEQLERAWFDLFPEMTSFLGEESDPGKQLADLLDLTPKAFFEATSHDGWNNGRNDGNEPASWLGGMCLKTLRGVPFRGSGEPYSSDEYNYFWDKAQSLAPNLAPKWAAALANREPSEDLWKAVKDLLGRAPVFTLTGRLRANASYCARHNTIFQGLAADGAKLALWKLWRRGFKIVNFIHDQVLVEVPLEQVSDTLAEEMARIMVESMAQVVPDVKVKVDWAYRKRWSKNKDDQVTRNEFNRENEPATAN